MSSREEARKKLIVALDVETLSEAQSLVRELNSSAGVFKVGYQLFTRYGPDAVGMVHNEGGEVFLDLKFHDIPNTVRAGIEAAVMHKVKMVNMHVWGGSAMMVEAVKTARHTAQKLGTPPPLVLGVTVLTSLADADLAELGINVPTTTQVQRLARLAFGAGLSGVVASPQEIPLIRDTLPRDFLIVTPGVRLATVKGDDQKRFLTPREAVALGADYVVVGRPILQAPNRAKAAQTVLDDLLQALT
jgi:orotidine-5'-phosphate decarboxylase